MLAWSFETGSVRVRLATAGVYYGAVSMSYVGVYACMYYYIRGRTGYTHSLDT